MDSHSKVHDEYTILAENLRHYENLSFANLAAFLTINGGLAGLAFAISPSLPAAVAPWIRIAGVVSVLVFGGHFGIYLQRWYRLVTRAMELEPELTYKQYQLISRPKNPKVGGWLWLLLFFFVLFFWCFAPLTLSPQDAGKPKTSQAVSGATISTNLPVKTPTQ